MEPDAPRIRLRFTGGLTDKGIIPAAELGQALQGWDRLLQLAYYNTESRRLRVPPSDTELRSSLRLVRVDRGSILVEGVFWATNHAAGGIIGGGAFAATLWAMQWAKSMIKEYVESKDADANLDRSVDQIERAASNQDIRTSRNRQDSEDVVGQLHSALQAATVPLDSSAAREHLELVGQTVDIQIDETDRAKILVPFNPPTVDIDSDPVIDALVKFIRINKRTGKGILRFVRPTDESQLGSQRFRCDDRLMRMRGNPYTKSFHLDTPIGVLVQRKAYEEGRHGHYWLIVGLAG